MGHLGIQTQKTIKRKISMTGMIIRLLNNIGRTTGIIGSNERGTFK